MLDQWLYRLKRPYHLVKTGLLRGAVAQLRYGFPARKLKIIAVTGTDGKTTTATLIYHLLQQAGKKTALISTVACYFGDQEIETGLHVTSPDPGLLQRWIKEMLTQEIEYLVLEVTSHGIYQFRTWGIRPLIAGITNVTHEHLDYHLTYENYLAAKALLFKQADIAVLNESDQSFAQLKKDLPVKKVITYSTIDRLSPQLAATIKRVFPEAFNQINARLAIKIAGLLKLTNQQLMAGLETFPGVPGRMQFVPNKRGLSVVVDFAHTPNGLESALIALRKRLKKGKKMIAVYGAAGLRDRQKRPLMGKVGVDLADLVVLTAEDPRTENVWSIIRQMKEQLVQGHQKIISISDRRQAIDFAINKLAKKDDIVGIFGKGPEKSMCYGKTEMPWSDVATVKEVLKK